MEATAKTKTSVSENDNIQPRHTDRQIWGIYIALCLISVVELYSASAFLVTSSDIISPVAKHVMFLAIGLCIMLFLQRQHYKKFLKWSYAFALISGLAMVYTMFFGDYINGARRSFNVGGLFDVQPAEMIKISAALMIAAILKSGRNQSEKDVSTKGLVLVLAVVIISGGLLILQGLTNTLLLMCISFSMMLIGGVSVKKLCKVVGAFIVIGLVFVGIQSIFSSGDDKSASVVKKEVYVPGTRVKVGVDTVVASDGGLFRFSTWKNRVQRHLKSDKYNEPINSTNQQEQYSYIAQAHGGITGVKPGNSRETARLPLAFSDYIYAIIIEELGLIGGIAVLLLYLWLLARAGRIASRCQTAYPALLVIGMAVYITFQAMFHMAIVTGLFPVSGQPLPLISKGGTSILITSMALGIMLSVSRFAARKGKRAEIKEELSALPNALSAENPV